MMPTKSNPRGAGRHKKKGLTQAQLRLQHQSAPDRDTIIILRAIKQLVEKRQISRQDMAMRSGLHPTTLGQYLDPFRNGFGSFRISIIRALARGCGVSLHELLRELDP